jgi:hypothetical protein
VVGSGTCKMTDMAPWPASQATMGRVAAQSDNDMAEGSVASTAQRPGVIAEWGLVWLTSRSWSRRRSGGEGGTTVERLEAEEAEGSKVAHGRLVSHR